MTMLKHQTESEHIIKQHINGNSIVHSHHFLIQHLDIIYIYQMLMNDATIQIPFRYNYLYI
ncbi:hypothetical protein HanIR_Chr03g0118661 [Helianthus annuus]|nr:hypothetical protein HanIR_Chr03g0118661 [Helianthus annuus]